LTSFFQSNDSDVATCPFVSCAHHLYLDVSRRTGAIKKNFPDLEVEEMTHSCALDVADRDGATLEEVGAIMNLTRERIRQIEVKALRKLEKNRARAAMALREMIAGETRTKVRKLRLVFKSQSKSTDVSTRDLDLEIEAARLAVPDDGVEAVP